MLKYSKRTFGALGLAVAGLSLAACGSGAGTGTPAGSMAPGQSMGSEPMGTGSMGTGSAAAAAMVGPGCAAYAKAVPSGMGSMEGMAQDPVAVAASHNPMLTQLTAAVSGKLNPKVNLVDTLDSGQYTVFAPVDQAFEQVPAATLKTLKADDAALNKVLTYHVVQGQLAPADVPGSHKTVEGTAVKVTGSGDNLMVNGAKVVCGGVKTANATVYLIDEVLMPPAK
ncbi:fasciclin domain-containing protein [Arthrobacter sp. I2-34]|uniref:Fasciclin domain-containing protein n=1 Tax=Arthrobacter hankyongi TaxID=2904801 RepID=A0ABS9L2P8_9MICC|nr:fasciclin domain-containing protein [Arthrobacter hankyongi]MCG2620853.1 fasciclin domain-containing protein [Arthrobacter hankyongi]